MYSFPSTSMMREPWPSAMKGGSPPTARKARTGESTPPGMSCSARCCSLRDCSVLRDMIRCEITIAANLREFHTVATLVQHVAFSFYLVHALLTGRVLDSF